MSKSLGKNVILNGIRTTLSLLFPLITYPYITRVLSPEGVGQANYSNSIANYFILLAALGISSYAVREGSKLRNSKEEFSCFANEMFSISLLACAFSYFCLFILLVSSRYLDPYRVIILIYSVEMLFKAIGIEWYYTVYEDFLYITIRSIAFQILSIILLFVMVRNPDDVVNYALVQVIACAGSNILNLIHACGNFKFRFIISQDMLKHMTPILLIFSTTLASCIYVNSDTTMLGIFSGNAEVGYYSVATKLYKIIKSVINSIAVVYSARLAFSYYSDKRIYNNIINDAYHLISVLTIPIAVGGALVSSDIIIVLSGESYLAANMGMKLLMISLIPATLGNLLCSGALIVVKREKVMLVATTFGALLNIILNFYCIPKMGCTGASITTLLTETTVLIILFIAAQKYVTPKFRGKYFIKPLLSCIWFVPVCCFFSNLIVNVFVRLSVTIIICCILYILSLIVLQDDMIIYLIKIIKKKILAII